VRGQHIIAGVSGRAKPLPSEPGHEREKEKQVCGRLPLFLEGHTLNDPKTPTRPQLLKAPHLPITPLWGTSFLHMGL
jgi:hypothetical protein